VLDGAIGRRLPEIRCVDRRLLANPVALPLPWLTTRFHEVTQ
jgi:hypothetical protein